ncbi:unnamed protein product [Cladocopium goreaui]|uniref:Uncharacterized protein n=1 Tax=Cladocopium goreaui TaxID=2562237 RepID=A0A9P1GJI2_9DINO|nr:unnamed protein product [Cladocopium goreaui]
MRRQQPYQPESPLSLSQSAARMMTYLAMPLVFAQTPAKDHLPSVSSTGPSDHSSPWAIKMKKKLTKKVRKRAKRNSKKRAMVRKYKNRRGESKVCGTANLRSSQIYPLGYGEALVKNHQNWSVSANNVLAFKHKVYSLLAGAKPAEAPYRFRHAALTELRDFLVAEKKAGRFHPLFLGGLE